MQKLSNLSQNTLYHYLLLILFLFFSYSLESKLQKNDTIKLIVNLVSIDNGTSHLSTRFDVIQHIIRDITRLSFNNMKTRSENKGFSCGPLMLLKKTTNYVSGQQEFHCQIQRNFCGCQRHVFPFTK